MIISKKILKPGEILFSILIVLGAILLHLTWLDIPAFMRLPSKHVKQQVRFKIVSNKIKSHLDKAIGEIFEACKQHGYVS